MADWSMEEEDDGDGIGNILYKLMDPNGICYDSAYDKEAIEWELNRRNNCEHDHLGPPYWGTGTPRPLVIPCDLCFKEVELTLDWSGMVFE